LQPHRKAFAAALANPQGQYFQGFKGLWMRSQSKEGMKIALEKRRKKINQLKNENQKTDSKTESAAEK